MSVPSKGITADNQHTIAELERLVQTYPFSNDTLLELLLKIRAEDNDAVKLAAQIERIFNLILMNVLVTVAL